MKACSSVEEKELCYLGSNITKCEQSQEGILSKIALVKKSIL